MLRCGSPFHPLSHKGADFVEMPRAEIMCMDADIHLKNQAAGNWVSGNSEILPNGPDQLRTLQLGTSKCRFQRTQNRRPFGTVFSKYRQERLQVLLDSLRQMTAGFCGQCRAKSEDVGSMFLNILGVDLLSSLL